MRPLTWGVIALSLSLEPTGHFVVGIEPWARLQEPAPSLLPGRASHRPGPVLTCPTQ